MDTLDTTLEIVTLGHFSLTVDGNPLATDWPDDTLKVFFCSLLSPLDLYFTWDRICRAILGVPETLTSRRQLEETVIRPLNVFLMNELGFNPVIAGHENIRIDQKSLHVDALEFNVTAVEGLRQLSLGNRSAARDKFNRAESLYAGSYLPEMPGKIIENTRNELECLYRTVIKAGVRQAGSQDKNH